VYFSYSPIGAAYGANTTFIKVFNGDVVTLNRGVPVYTHGAQGDSVSVKRAYNTSDDTSARTLGLVWETIAPGEYGYVIETGVLDRVNTGAYTSGDILYLGATPGTLTNVKPVAPNHMVYIGVVERANAGNGQILIKVQNGYELEELHNVLIVDPQPGDTLVYDDATELWVNGAAASGGASIPSELQRYSAGTAETFDRITGITTGRTYSNGVAYLTAITPNSDVTASEVSVYSTTAGSGLTLVRIGLYTFDGTTYTLVAQTADIKASFAGNNTFVTAPFSTVGGFPATYDLLENTTYYVGILQTGTTPATINGPATPSAVSGVTAFINSGSPKLSRSIGGQTDLAATYLESGVNNSVIMAYARFS
jgi:hypothetical protein